MGLDLSVEPDFGDTDLTLGVDFLTLLLLVGVRDFDLGIFFWDDFGDFLFCADFGVLGVCFFPDFRGDLTGDSSLIGEVDIFIASDLCLSTGGAGEAGLSGIILGGIAPLLTGVEGGNFLSKCSGDNFGPNDTLFLLADGASRCSIDFLFFPVLPFFS